MKYIILGGTGTAANIFINSIQDRKKIVIFSRSEYSQFNLQQQYPEMTYILGDIRNKQSLLDIINKNDMVFLFAAIKHISNGEKHPKETVSINIDGVRNTIDVCHNKKAKLVFLSTDKSVFPTSTYGCTKLIAEKMVNKTKDYIIIRSGNIVNSRGSIFDLIKSGQKIKLHHPDMERYFVSQSSLRLLFEKIINNEIEWNSLVMPLMFKMKIKDLLDRYKCDYEISTKGTGEKLKENLLWMHEKAVKMDGYYKIKINKE